MSDTKPELAAPNVSGMLPEAAVAALVEHAAKLPASDLFYSTNENHVAVSVRHFGMMRLLTILSSDLGRRCVSYIKAMAGVDLAETRRPLDGRWIHELTTGNRVDLRISTLPTLYGEDLTIRLLNYSANVQGIDQVGLSREEQNILTSMLNSPSGLILVTGPVGSGKTTTLYAGLKYLNNGERKINTIEDPIEYSIPGLRQSQVNTKAEVGFPELLRSVLRQSPDVIMVGEIRDHMTAETAVRAANSGHLVLATLHAPIASAAVQSMLSLGVHPHFLSSSLIGIIAQRLVRTLCPACKVSFDVFDSAPHIFDEVRPWLERGQGEYLYVAKGCKECYQSGYSGRTGVFEVLKVSREVRRLVAEGRPTREIRQQAAEEGLLELRRSALLRVAQGLTSAEEVLRAIPAEYLGIED